MRSFASDNNSGAHPLILQAITQANIDHEVGYGDDHYTVEAIEEFKKILGKEIEVFFVFGGTGANVLSIKALTNPFNAVICAETSHINVDECGAPENFTGCKLIPLKTSNGKINPQMILPKLHVLGDQHHAQPRVISISQCTEVGTIYSPAEIKDLADFAHKHSMFLHIDGARIANAVAALNCDMRTMISDTGADVISFGGTKNGMIFGEAIVFINRELANNMKFIRKQGMQLFSKMRYISAQFSTYLRNDLYLENANNANQMCKYFYEKIKMIPAIKITQKVETNAIFAIIPRELNEKLLQKSFFYVWNEEINEVRWMTSFDTNKQDIDDFVKYLQDFF